MKRLVLVGDSLGMPRSNSDYEATYPNILKTLLPDWDVISRHRRANQADLQARPENLTDDIEFLRPTIVIVHLGIVDCAPRLFSKTQKKYLSRMPEIIRLYIIHFFSKNRSFMTKIFPKVNVDKKSFRESIERIVETIQKNRALPVIIEIADTTLHQKMRSHNFENNIKAYNCILKETCEKTRAAFISLNEENILIDDGIHLNAKGHQLLATKIADVVRASPL